MIPHTDFKFHRQITQIGCYWGGGGHTELYLLEGERLAIVDTGVSTTPAEYVAPALAAIGRELSDVEVIVNTHGHHDHAGGNRAVKDASGCEIWIHRDDAEITQDADRQFELYFARNQRLLGQANKLDAARDDIRANAGKPAAVTRTFADGDLLDLGHGIELRVVHLPGHTRGCCALLWEHEGIAISGDSVLGRGSREGGLPLIFFPDDYRRSLDRVRELRPRAMCLGHHYRSLRQTNESIRYGDLVPAFVAESGEIQDAIESAVEVAVRDLGKDAPFDRIGRRALRSIEEHMPLANDASGWPNGAIGAMSSVWSRLTSNPV